MVVGAILLLGGMVVGIISFIEKVWPILTAALLAFSLGVPLLLIGASIYSDGQQERCEDAGGYSVVPVGRGSICVSEDGRIVPW
jgi:hypothetical protein